MASGTPIVPPAGPTSPQASMADKGLLRLTDTGMQVWSGTDWESASIPAQQLSDPVSVDPATGHVTLESGLIVAGGATADSLVTSALTVNGASTLNGTAHVTGALTADSSAHVIGTLAADSSAHVGGALTADGFTTLNGAARTVGIHTVDDLVVFGSGSSPRGGAYTSARTSHLDLIGSTEQYAGFGMTWTYDATRRLMLLVNFLAAGVGTNAGAYMTCNIRAGLGNTVNTADPQINGTKVPIGSAASGGITLIGILPPGQWANGVVVYAAAFVVCTGLTAGTGSIIAGVGFPATMTQTDMGT